VDQDVLANTGRVRAEAAARLLRAGRVIDVLMSGRLLSPGRGARRFDPATVQIIWKMDHEG
jgi:hypothetical protein